MAIHAGGHGRGRFRGEDAPVGKSPEAAEAAGFPAGSTGEYEKLENNPPTTPEDVQKQSETVRKLLDTLSRYEQELSKMRKDADTKDRQQKEIRVRAAKTKLEFDQLKEVYDKEFKEDTAKLQTMRSRTEQEAKKVEPKLLAKYRSIKQHCTPPMAKLINNQCSGCFMSLPSATLLDIRSGDRIVECDNCGRILYDAGE